MQRIQTIGQGGLGVVSLYRQDNGGLVAVKQMLHNWNHTYYDKFMREMTIMVNLAHKNIIKLYNYSTDRNNPYYVMPYYKDGSLRDQLNKMQQRGQKFSPQGTIGIVRTLAIALAHAHVKGIIHRDLSQRMCYSMVENPLLPIGELVNSFISILLNLLIRALEPQFIVLPNNGRQAKLIKGQTYFH